MSARIYKQDGRTSWVKSERGANQSFDRIDQQIIYPQIRRMLLEDGKSDTVVAEALGISDRTVLRYRQRHEIGNIYKRGAR